MGEILLLFYTIPHSLVFIARRRPFRQPESIGMAGCNVIFLCSTMAYTILLLWQWCVPWKNRTMVAHDGLLVLCCLPVMFFPSGQGFIWMSVVLHSNRSRKILSLLNWVQEEGQIHDALTCQNSAVPLVILPLLHVLLQFLIQEAHNGMDQVFLELLRETNAIWSCLLVFW